MGSHPNESHYLTISSYYEPRTKNRNCENELKNPSRRPLQTGKTETLALVLAPARLFRLTTTPPPGPSPAQFQSTARACTQLPLPTRKSTRFPTNGKVLTEHRTTRNMHNANNEPDERSQ
jgi:hypothetical protein